MKNLKFIFLLVCTVGLISQVRSQDLAVNDVPSTAFSGVKSIEGKMYYLLTSVDGSFTDRDLILISPELKELGRHRLTLGSYADIESVAINGNTVLFYISGDKIGHLYLFDLSGQTLKHREIQAPSNWLNTGTLYPAGDMDYFLIRQIKPKKVGFSVELLSPTLESKWQKDYVAEKGKTLEEVSTASKDQIAIMYKKQKTRGVICFGIDGQIKYDKPLAHSEEEMMLRPSHATFNAAGDLAVFGNFEEESMVKYTGQRYRYFTAVFDQTGTSKSFNFKAWDEQEISQIRSQSVWPYYTEGKSPDLYIHEYKATNSGYQIIGETFRFVPASHDDYPAVGGGSKVAGSDMPNIYARPAYFFAMDLIVIDYDQEGQILNISRTGRPVKRTASTGRINSVKAHSAANQLVDYGRFNYRFTTQTADGEPVFVSLGQHFNHIYTGFIRSGDPYENLFTRDYLGIKVGASSGSGELANAIYKEQDLPTKTLAENNWMVRSEILPATPGKYILVEYTKNKTLNFTLKDVEPTPDVTQLQGVATNKITYSPVLKNHMGLLYYSEAADFGEYWAYLLIDQELKVKRKQVVVFPKGIGRTITISNGQTVLTTGRVMNNETMIFLSDQNGEILKLETRPAIANGAGETMWFNAGESGYYGVTRLRNENLSGYEISAYDNQFETKWTKQYWDSEVMGSSIQVVATNENGLLIKERKSWKTRALFQYFSFNSDQLVHVDANGTRQEYQDLLTEGNWRQGVLYASGQSENYYAAGIAFKSISKTEWDSEGLWVEQAGQSTHSSILSWEKIAAEMELPNLEENMKNGELRFRLMALSEVGDELMLLTELVTYEKVSKNPFQYVLGNGVLSDFMVFKFDKNGVYKGFHIIEKTPLNLTTISNAMNLFSFQYLVNEGKQIIFTDLGEDLEPYAVSTTILDTNSRKYLYAHARMADEVKIVEKTEWKPQTKFEQRLYNLNQKAENMDQKLSAFETKVNGILGEKPAPPNYKRMNHTGYINGGLNYIFVYHHNLQDTRLRLESRKMW